MCLLDGVPAVDSLSDNEHISLQIHQGADSLPDHGMIVGDEHPDLPRSSVQQLLDSRQQHGQF